MAEGLPRFDHVGITVADLTLVTDFFVGLGLEVDGSPMVVEGEFLDTVIGMSGSRTEIVMLRPPGGGTCLELSRFVRHDHRPGSPQSMANELGLRNVAFEVDDPAGRPRPAGAGRVRAGRGDRRVRGRLADGLRARPGGHHRVPGRADRLNRLPRGGCAGNAPRDEVVPCRGRRTP